MFSSSVSPAYFVLVLACTLFSLKVLSRWATVPPIGERFATIDGLRGWLALMVFVHHACIWYFASHGRPWKVPPSHLYTHLGQSSVVLFFMITGFLFFSRVIRSGSTGPDWLQLATSRVLRLVPLYSLAIAFMVIGALAMTDWTFRESGWKFAKTVIHWLLFTITYAPLLNGFEQTGQLLAGVVWSLPYEWFFYACLPLLTLLTGRHPPWWAIAFSSIAAAQFWLWQPRSEYLLAFACGMAAAVLVDRPGLQLRNSKRWPDFLILAMLALLVWHYPSGVGHVQVFMLGVVFFFIASGASFFGSLLHPLSRLLGEMAYGIYLMHGLLLFAFFGAGPGKAGLSAPMHWAAVLALVPLLIGFCWLAHCWVERPAMQAVSPTLKRLRRPKKTPAQ